MVVFIILLFSLFFYFLISFFFTSPSSLLSKSKLPSENRARTSDKAWLSWDALASFNTSKISVTYRSSSLKTADSLDSVGKGDSGLNRFIAGSEPN